MLCCRAGKLSQYAFRPVRLEREVALPADWTFVVASTGVTAEKSGGRARALQPPVARRLRDLRSLACRREGRGETLGEAVARARRAEGIRDVLAAARIRGLTPASLLERFDQFLEESEVLVPAAAEAFESGDATALGDIAARSQTGAERLLGNQIPETIGLVASARALGALAASAFGAGFGGSVWALVP